MKVCNNGNENGKRMEKLEKKVVGKGQNKSHGRSDSPITPIISMEEHNIGMSDALISKITLYGL